MPRQCQVCASPALLTINAKLRGGESQSAIARAHGLSDDAVRRHAMNHLTASDDAASIELQGRLETLWARCDEMYQAATKDGNLKVAVEALSKLSYVAEQLSRVRATDESSFLTWPIEKQVEYIYENKPLLLAILDRTVSNHRLIEAEKLTDNLTDSPAN